MENKSGIDIRIQNFWKYASTLRGTHDLDDVFVKWTSLNPDITINELKNIWEGVNHDIKSAFDSNDIESITNLIQTVMQGGGNAEETQPPINMEDVAPTAEETPEEPKPTLDQEPAAETTDVLNQMSESGKSPPEPLESNQEKPEKKDMTLTESLLL